MRITSILILLITLIFFSFQEVKMSKGAQKKMNKALLSVWETEVKLAAIDLSKIESIKAELVGSEQVQRVWSMDDTLQGYAVMSQAEGRYDMFDLLILYDEDLNILNTAVLVYREDWGGEIASARWLKQFIGLNSTNNMALAHDIQGISGATISCQSAAQEIKRVTRIITRMKEQGVLNI